MMKTNYIMDLIIHLSQEYARSIQRRRFLKGPFIADECKISGGKRALRRLTARSFEHVVTLGVG